jgi:hypothetical protein
MRRSDICLYFGPADCAGLQALITNRNTRRKLVWRSGIMRVTADGQGSFGIMRRARMTKPTVRHRRERYADEGMAGLKRDRMRPSRVPPLPMETKLKVIAKAVQEAPPKAMQGGRARMAGATGISPSGVGRIWAEAGLQPHRTTGFRVLNDPLFEKKVTDIVGLDLDPPVRAVVLCDAGKSRVRAPDRTWPGVPLKKDCAATMTQDCRRHGTTMLFAAFGVTSGVVIAASMPRLRAKEVLNFLRQIDKTLPGTRDGHLVPDTCATQKTPGVKAWLDKHPRCKRHCRPTGASWRTLVERFFAQITARRIRGGRSSSVDALAAAIHDCLAQHSGKPKPCNWT